MLLTRRCSLASCVNATCTDISIRKKFSMFHSCLRQSSISLSKTYKQIPLLFVALSTAVLLLLQSSPAFATNLTPLEQGGSDSPASVEEKGVDSLTTGEEESAYFNSLPDQKQTNSTILPEQIEVNPPSLTDQVQCGDLYVTSENSSAYTWDASKNMLTISSEDEVWIKNVDVQTPSAARIVVSGLQQSQTAHIVFDGLNLKYDKYEANSIMAPFYVQDGAAFNTQITLNAGTRNSLISQSSGDLDSGEFCGPAFEADNGTGVLHIKSNSLSNPGMLFAQGDINRPAIGCTRRCIFNPITIDSNAQVTLRTNENQFDYESRYSTVLGSADSLPDEATAKTSISLKDCRVTILDGTYESFGPLSFLDSSYAIGVYTDLNNHPCDFLCQSSTLEISAPNLAHVSNASIDNSSISCKRTNEWGSGRIISGSLTFKNSSLLQTQDSSFTEPCSGGIELYGDEPSEITNSTIVLLGQFRSKVPCHFSAVRMYAQGVVSSGTSYPAIQIGTLSSRGECQAAGEDLITNNCIFLAIAGQQGSPTITGISAESIASALTFTGYRNDPEDTSKGISWDGAGTMYGDVSLAQDFILPANLTIPNGQVLSVQQGAAIKILASCQLINEGSIASGSTIVCEGSGNVKVKTNYYLTGATKPYLEAYQTYQTEDGVQNYKDLPNPDTNDAFLDWYYLNDKGQKTVIRNGDPVLLNEHDFYEERSDDPTPPGPTPEPTPDVTPTAGNTGLLPTTGDTKTTMPAIGVIVIVLGVGACVLSTIILSRKSRSCKSY